MAYLDGEGCKLSLDGAEIGQRTSITGPSRVVAEKNVTHLDSTHREFIPSKIPESGTVTFEYEYDPSDTSHMSVEALMDTPAAGDWILTYSDGTKRSFSGFPTSHETSGMTVDGTVLASVTIRITGAITSTEAA